MFTKVLKKLKKLICYFIFSCIAAVLDFSVTTILLNLFSVYYIIASTIGIVTGFIFQSVMSIKAVFNVKFDIKSFSIYLITFFIGLIMANTVLMISFEILGLNFVVSKFLSMGLPFFATYFLRGTAYKLIEGIEHDEQGV